VPTRDSRIALPETRAIPLASVPVDAASFSPSNGPRLSRARAYIQRMQSISSLKTIPDDELLRRLAALLAGSRRTEADLVAHIGEVEERRLYAREASPSMFVYCLERLHLSEAEAYLRIAAARASREHPVVLEMLADGRLHLSAIAKLAPHLTPESRDALLERATHKTKREIEELLAELGPRPDVAPSIRRMPACRLITSPASAKGSLAEAPASLTALSPGCVAGPTAGSELRPDQVVSDGSGGVVPPGRESAPCGGPAPWEPAPQPPLLRPVEARTQSAVIEPLGSSRYKVQFTASAELRDKLERLRDLMRSSVPDGDLAAIVDAAVTEKLERLEALRFGRTKAPRKQLSDTETAPDTGTASNTETAPTTRHVPAAIRRAVHERDEGRCRYVDAQGRRCMARTMLQFHHRYPFAVGGAHSLGNVSLLCKAHNQYLARIDFGSEAVARHCREAVARHCRGSA
jgi:5-methylcytosine-specific restriction endonuclease McrA